FIRLSAAIAVIYAHSYPLTSSFEDPLKNFSSDKISFGSLAVAIFFIISGLLISQSFHRSDLLKFTVARILRIYHALVVITLLSVFILGPVFTNFSWSSYFTDRMTLKYLFNVFSIRIQHHLPGVFENNYYPNTVNGSLWTLPIEIACYGLIASIGLLIN